jgi:hypothetical protein
VLLERAPVGALGSEPPGLPSGDRRLRHAYRRSDRLLGDAKRAQKRLAEALRLTDRFMMARFIPVHCQVKNFFPDADNY